MHIGFGEGHYPFTYNIRLQQTLMSHSLLDECSAMVRIKAIWCHSHFTNTIVLKRPLVGRWLLGEGSVLFLKILAEIGLMTTIKINQYNGNYLQNKCQSKFT